jgi:hypothetical protein
MNISYLCKQRIVKRDWGSKIQKIFVLVTIGIVNGGDRKNSVVGLKKRGFCGVHLIITGTQDDSL